jgi:hypothetical protein
MWGGLCLLLSACGSDADTTPPGDLGPPQGPCGAVTQAAPPDQALHYPQGTQLTWQTNPPAEGPHYPVWAPWATAYTEVVPRGNWLHNAEHGGVILLYNCPSGCPDVVAQLQSLGTGLPQDASCEPPINARWVMTPDPLLPAGTQVAAVGWGYLYTATCFDATTLQPFLTAHYAHGPEDFCSQGAIDWR